VSAVSWISFGPDLEPFETESRRQAETPGPRVDGLLVAGEAAEVAGALAEACRSAGGWCRLERVGTDGERQPVHVQARHVRFVAPASGGGPEPR
jgi:hypothetical protein